MEVLWKRVLTKVVRFDTPWGPWGGKDCTFAEYEAVEWAFESDTPLLWIAEKKINY